MSKVNCEGSFDPDKQSESAHPVTTNRVQWNLPGSFLTPETSHQKCHLSNSQAAEEQPEEAPIHAQSCADKGKTHKLNTQWSSSSICEWSTQTRPEPEGNTEESMEDIELHQQAELLGFNIEQMQIVKQMMDNSACNAVHHDCELHKAAKAAQSSQSQSQPNTQSWSHSLASSIILEQQQLVDFAKEQFMGNEPIKLKGKSNFIQWHESILIDARMINATHFLTDDIPPPEIEQDAVQKAWWTKLNEILQTWIIQSLSHNVKAALDWDDIGTSSGYLWVELTAKYSISIVEQQLATVKEILTIQPQGDYVAITNDYNQLITKLKKLNVNANDLYHDIYICLIGNWHHEHVQNQLDQWFAATGDSEEITNIELKAFQNQLIARSSRPRGQYKAQNLQEFKQSWLFNQNTSKPIM